MAKSVPSSAIKIPVNNIKMVTPACFEAVLDRHAPFTPNQDYTFLDLDDDINTYYNNYDVLTEKIYVPKQGEVIVICHPKDQRWYRAKMVTTIETTKGYRANVHLLDVNERANVPFESVRKIDERFSAYTPRGVTLELIGLTPCSLKYNAYTLLLEPRENDKWDTHAYKFVESLLKRAEAALFNVLGVISPEKFLGKLYLQTREEAKCLNDLLVEKHYAFMQEAYDSEFGKELDDVPLGGSATTYRSFQSHSVVESSSSPVPRPRSRLEEWEMMQEELRKKAKDLDCNMEASLDSKKSVAHLSQSTSMHNTPSNFSHDKCNPTKCTESSVKADTLPVELRNSRKGSSAAISYEGDRHLRRRMTPAVLASSDNRVKRYMLPRLPSPSPSSETVQLTGEYKIQSDVPLDLRISSVGDCATTTNKLDVKEKPTSPVSKDVDSTSEKSANSTQSVSQMSNCRIQRLSPSEFFKKLKRLQLQATEPSSVCIEQNESGKVTLAKIEKTAPEYYSMQKEEVPLVASKQNLGEKNPNVEDGTDLVACSSAHLDRHGDVKEKRLSSSEVTGTKEAPAPAATKTTVSLSRSLAITMNSPDTLKWLSLGRGRALKGIQCRYNTGSIGNYPCGRFFESANNVEASTEDETKDSIEQDAVRHSSTHRFYVTPPTNPYFSTSMDDPLGLDSKTLRKILVCGWNSPKPIRDIAKASFHTFIVGRLKSCKIDYPATIQSYVWPAVMRGRNVAVVGGPRSGKTYSYVLPLLSFILDNVMYTHVPTGNEPLAVVLCAFWRSATQVYDSFMEILNECQTVRVLLIHGGGYDETQKIQLINGCDILVATPCAILRILRGDGTKPTSLNRLCHLVLDEMDILTEEFTEELKELIGEYSNVLKRRRFQSLPCQILTFGCKWTLGLKSFVANVMPNPLFYCSSFCESIIFAGIKTVAHTYFLEERAEKLLDLLKPNLIENNTKIVICTSSDKTAKDLHHTVSYACRFNNVKLATEDLSPSEVLRVGESWQENYPHGQQSILIVADGCLEELNIEDAECLIHYDIPALYKSNFGLRFSCLLKHMQRVNITQKYSGFEATCITHIITTNDCVLQAHGLIQLLKRLSCEIPTRLLYLALGHYQGGEERKDPLPFCANIKAFGHCSNQYWCTERHILSPMNEGPSSLISRGSHVTLRITDVRHATSYFARIIKYQNSSGAWEHAQPNFLTLNSEISMHFAKKSNCVLHSSPKVGDVYAIVGTDGGYYRLRVLEKPYIKVSTRTCKVRVLLMDLGRKCSVEVKDLLELPTNLASYPPQALEVFLCNLRPVDKDCEWTNKACTVVDGLICGENVIGKVALCLGRVMWLSSLVKQTKLTISSDNIAEFNLHQKLIADKFAIDNPNHLPALERLAEEAFTLPPPVEIAIAEKSNAAPDETLNPQYAFLPLENEEAVYVSCLQNPGRFFVMKVSSHICLENLMNELENYRKENPQPVEHVVLGMFCIAVLPNDGCFYRGKVIEILPSKADKSLGGEVRIFYVDYGDEYVVKSSFVYPLHHKYVWRLPFQAIECNLASVVPSSESGWTEEASNLMWKNTFDEEDYKKALMIKALKKCLHVSVSGGPCYEVSLSDLRNEVEVNLSDWLCSTGHATFAKIVDQQSDVETENRDKGNSVEYSKTSNECDVINGCCETNCDVKLFDRQDLSGEDRKLQAQRIQPHVLWSDTKSSITLQIKIAGVKKDSLSVKSTHLHYRTVVDYGLFELKVDMYEEIVEFVHEILDNCVRVKLKKRKPEKWPRFLKDKSKVFWLSVDYDKLENSDEEETALTQFEWHEVKEAKKEVDRLHYCGLDMVDAAPSSSEESAVGSVADSLASDTTDNFNLF